MPHDVNYSPNPSPMVPDAQPLHEPGPQIRPPPIPSYAGSQAPPTPPSWANQGMNAFPQGYPTSTPYQQQQYMPMAPPGSYYNPPVVLPSNVPSTPQQPIGADGFSTDWVGPPAGAQGGWPPAPPAQTPYNGPQPHTGFNAFQQQLPGAGFGQPPPGFGQGPPPGFGQGPPPGFGQWPGAAPPGAYAGMSTPAAWHQAQAPPAAAPGWGAPPAAWSQPPPQQWGGGLPPGTPWVGGGGPPAAAWAPPQQQFAPPPVVPQPPPASAIHAHRDRSNEGLDQVDKFAPGPHYHPVLTPLLLRIVGAKLEINPLLCPPDVTLENTYLKWNMLFTASHCVRSDDPPQRSWARGRMDPATHPRLTQLTIVSRTIPWIVNVRAQNDLIGVTCGDVIDRLDDFLHKNVKKEDTEMDHPTHKNEMSAAYYHNRSTALGVPGGRLGDGLRRLDWLCKDTMFGGIVADEAHVIEAFHAPVPGVVTLVCTTRYPLTAQEAKEQEDREKKEQEAEKLKEKLRLAEERAAEAEARERERQSRRSSRSVSRSSRGRSVREESSEEEEEEDETSEG